MKTTLTLLSAFLTAVQAGNICVAGNYHASKAEINNPVVFAAGSPCDDSKSVTFDDMNLDNICDNLPFGVRICDQDSNLVKITTGPDSGFGCQIGLEIGGTVHEAEVDKYNPDDGNAHNGPCDASCSLTGIDGFLHFVGVPMCG